MTVSISQQLQSSGGPRRRVVVAMSGGVDSAVTAALMQRAGHDVVGITMQLYDHGAAVGRKGACCAGEDIRDARSVADRLGIPHYVLDYESRFRAAVIDAFADAYVRGETPLPCVACNQEVKFKDLLAFAEELGADALATGHYVERVDGPQGPQLHRAADEARDQSYFLFATTRAQLQRLWFPLGAMSKPDVRAIADELGLAVAAKPDSQDICFVASGRYSDVVRKLRPEAGVAGDIVHVDGRVLGRHDGIVSFTVGQRRGLGIATGEPLFVVGLDAAVARVVVGPREALAVDVLRLRDFNWLGDGEIVGAAGGQGLDIHVRIRSTQPPRPARLRVGRDGCTVDVELPGGELGVAPGQACVIYADGTARARVLGGGFIAATQKMGEKMGTATIFSAA